MLSSPFSALVWVPLALIRRNRNWRQVGPRLVVLLAAAAFFAWIRLFTTSGPMTLASANPVTVTLLLLNLGFAGLSAFGLVLAIREATAPGGRAARLHTLLASLACCGMTLYLFGWGLLGLRTWAW